MGWTTEGQRPVSKRACHWPRVITAPGVSHPEAQRWASMYTPLVLPRSSIQNVPCGVRQMRAWCWDTPGTGRTMVLSVAAPSVTHSTTSACARPRLSRSRGPDRGDTEAAGGSGAAWPGAGAAYAGGGVGGNDGVGDG